ncbi:MAG: sigma 54-interacting transcriptional regulator [Dehalobacterium sp.]
MKKIEELEKDNSLLRQIIDHIYEGVQATDEKGRILFFNPEVAKCDGLTSAAIGKTEREVYADPNFNFFDIATKKVLRTGKPILEQRYSYTNLHGKTTHLIYSCYPFIYKGQIAGTYEIGRDVHQINRFINETLAVEKQINMENNKMKSDTCYFLRNIIGESPQIKECVELAHKVSQYDMPVMIIGETGTGKEIFAQGIHNAGKTTRGCFVSVNCAALPESLLESILFGTAKGSFTGAVDTPGLFEQAENGSLFLDEINSMPLFLQGKLLRVLQEKKVRRIGGKEEIPVNCRIISASNEDINLDNSVKKNQGIRMDLLFRLSAATIYIPPLRKRKEDIPVLCQHFLRKSNRSKSIYLWDISPKLLDLFYHYDWPGNVRELENVLWNCVLYTEPQERLLMVEHVPAHLRQKFSQQQEHLESMREVGLNDALNEFEKRMIIETILKLNSNISKAAETLKISRQNLYYKIERLHLTHILTLHQKKN